MNRFLIYWGIQRIKSCVALSFRHFSSHPNVGKLLHCRRYPFLPSWILFPTANVPWRRSRLRLHWSPSHRVGSNAVRFSELFTMILRVDTCTICYFIVSMIEAILVITWVTKPKSKTSGTDLYQLASGASLTFLSFYGRASRPNAAEWTPPPRGRSYAKRGKNPLSNLPNYQIHRQVINPRRDGRQLVRLLMLPWSIIMSHLWLDRERD